MMNTHSFTHSPDDDKEEEATDETMAQQHQPQLLAVSAALRAWLSSRRPSWVAVRPPWPHRASLPTGTAHSAAPGDRWIESSRAPHHWAAEPLLPWL